MSIVIIDYGSGNLRSAEKAFARMGKGRDVSVTSDPTALAGAAHIVLPGVGSFGDCAAGLNAIDGMGEALHEAVMARAIPFLGICVGMQLMCETGYERGTYKGLGWLPAEVRALQVSDGLKVPHMGWNNIELARPHPVFDGLDGADMYFVHSYGAQAAASDIAATTDYGGPVVAAVARDNMIGTQFHPEKSQHAGLRLIENFLEWRP